MAMSFPTAPPESFHGLCDTTQSAILLANAAHQGFIPRTTRRLNETERSSDVLSGCVFIYTEKESGVQRWTDHLFWCPSSVSGNFLVYREVLERSRVRKTRRDAQPSTSNAPLVNSPHPKDSREKSLAPELQPNTSSGSTSVFKPDGLCKRTITITINSVDLHIVAYHKLSDIHSGQRLQPPATRDDILRIPLSVAAFQLSNLRHPPQIVAGSNGVDRFMFQSEPVDAFQNAMIQPGSPFVASRSSTPLVSTLSGQPLPEVSRDSLVPPSPSTSNPRWPLADPEEHVAHWGTVSSSAMAPVLEPYPPTPPAGHLPGFPGIYNQVPGSSETAEGLPSYGENRLNFSYIDPLTSAWVPQPYESLLPKEIEEFGASDVLLPPRIAESSLQHALRDSPRPS